MAIHFEAHDTVCIGDAIATYAVTTGREGPQIAPFTADPGEALASLARLDRIDPRLVLPGHGQAWDGGLAAALRIVRERAATPGPARSS